MFVPIAICAFVCLLQSTNAGMELHPQTTIWGSLRPGRTQSYPLNLESGSIAELILQQGGADLVATIISPIGHRITVDEREDGPEPVLVDASATGQYQLEVSAKGSGQALSSSSWLLASFIPSGRTIIFVWKPNVSRLRPNSLAPAKHPRCVKRWTAAPKRWN